MTLTNLQKAENELTATLASLEIVEQAIKAHQATPPTPLDQTDCEVYLELLKPMRADLDEIQGKILNGSPSDPSTYNTAHTTNLTRIVTATMALMRLHKSLTRVPPPPPPPASKPKIPTINIPTFSGRFEDWQSFKDIYEAIVHNTTVSDVEKFTHLKSKVEGEALLLIRNFSLTTQDYHEAWATLNQRYNNTREIVQSHVKRFFNISSVKHGSAEEIQSFLDKTNECIRALKVLNQPTDKWDVLLVHITLDKLDSETRKQWALSLTGTDVPLFSELNDFIQKHIRGLHAWAGPAPSKPNSEKRASSHFVQSNNHQSSQCSKCRESHPLYKCSQFLSLSVRDRNSFVKEQNLCYNCLKPSSKSHKTDNCPSSSCRVCNGKHNTLLHYPRPAPQEKVSAPPPPPKSSNVARMEKDILLSTAIVKTQDGTGAYQQCRVVLDNCSQATLISEECVRRLGLSRKWDRTKITGVGSTSAGTSRGKVSVVLYSCHSNESLAVEALIFPTVTSEVPTYNLEHDWNHINDLCLADPQYFQPAPVDLLLGAEYSGMACRDGKREVGINSPIALNTMFGWVVTGRVNVKQVNSIRIHHVQQQQEPADSILQKFWEIETVPKPKYLTAEEKLCEESFAKTYIRERPSGRFCVQLPLNNNINQLGYSREQAVRRWSSVEKRLAKNPDHRQEYNKFMQEYINLGHMCKIPGGEVLEKLGKTYYMPHHFIVRPDSTSTKFRVVFDASAKSSTGMSLNDCMSVGATLQSDIFALLLKFRTYQVAVKADIAKMFRQFKVSSEHCDLQRIVWREKPTDPIQDYKLLTVTYGTASAPFLSTRCLQELADLNKHQYPTTTAKLASELYVDDLMSGANSEEEAIHFINELVSIAESAQLSFRKFASNSTAVLESIPADFRESSLPLSFDKEADVKALGIQWNPKADTFTFTQPEISESAKKVLTKRAVLSQLAKVYDPLGFLSPVTVAAKMFMQKLWKCELGWDVKLSEDMQHEWASYSDNIANINLIKIPRCVNPPFSVKNEIHAFCDASEKAFGSVIYLRSKISNNNYSIKLLASKSRVAPIKTVSLPRLELCGALLLTEVLQQVMEVIPSDLEIYAWTDSMICLQWLNSHPGRWQTFVANRVAKIQEAVPFEKWNHVTSEDNPADLVSRGISAKALSESTLWWSGPHWLQCDDLPAKVIVNKSQQHPNMEEKKQPLMSAHIKLNQDLINHFSSLNRLKRTVAYMFRFVQNCKSKTKELSPLSTSELARSMNSLIVMVQSEAFPEEVASLQTNQPVSSKSKLSSLNPFIDDKGVMRVGGRLQKALISSGAQHQIILPGNVHFTKLLINHAHMYHGHGGNKLVWCFLRQTYWIQSARNSIRFELRKCVKCRRHRADKMTQLMGSLPTSRVTPGRVFQHCGVDYAGPFNLRVMKGRSNKLFKSYFCIFICMATKAVHLEPVSDLTTEAFLATLNRFVSRRGVPASIHSDNGTNFKGADKELQRLFNDEQRNNDIINHLSSRNIRWIFNPPAASHQGGIWEAGVKSVKFHLKRIIGESTLTFEEFATVLCQVESYLNSRPLCPLSSDIDDYDVLTPGHFIIGQPLTAIPSEDVTPLKVNKLSRWQFTQQISQHFWKRWHAEYLTTLQQRWKWQRKSENFSIGDLVIVHEELVPPSKWKLARVIDIHSGHDGCVRVVTIKTRTGTTKRPITKLTPILFNSEQD